jgi:type I restriction enzyme S subunit
VKKREGTDVLETKIKVSKTQKETGRDYKFSKSLQTTKVKFYDYNPYVDVKNLLVEVPIEKIASNSYSLNYAEYMKDETEEDQYEEGVVVKTLGEVCNFKNGKGIKKDTLIEGEYPVIGGGQKPMGVHNEYNADEHTILCSSSGAYAGFISKYDKKVWASDCFSIMPKNNSINNTYLYYLLKTIQDKIYKLQTGTAQPHIYSKDLQNIKIPIPSLERQEEIVKYLDFIYEKSNKTSNAKIMELKQLNQFCLNNQKIFGENVVKTLGETCNFNIGGTPARSNSEYYDNGQNLWVSVRELNGGYIYDTKEKITDLGVQNSSVKLFVKDTILFSFKLSIGKTAIVGNPLYSNEAIAGILSKNNDTLTNKYLYYYLNINDFTKLGSGMLGNGSLNKKSLEQITIIIPSLERQKEIVEYCEYNDALIQQLEKEIENNKKQAQQFITGIVKSQGLALAEEPDNTNSDTTELINEIQKEIEEVLEIEPKPKITNMVNKIKKRLVIVEEMNKV